VRRRHRGGSPATAPEAVPFTGEDEYSSSPVPPVPPTQNYLREEGREVCDLEREGMLKNEKTGRPSLYIHVREPVWFLGTGPVYFGFPSFSSPSFDLHHVAVFRFLLKSCA